MDITEKEKAQLQKIVTDDVFELLQRIASALLVNWNQGNLIKETEFLTVVEAVGREERKKALLSFIKTIEELSHNG